MLPVLSWIHPFSRVIQVKHAQIRYLVLLMYVLLMYVLIFHYFSPEKLVLF